MPKATEIHANKVQMDGGGEEERKMCSFTQEEGKRKTWLVCGPEKVEWGRFCIILYCQILINTL